MSDLPNFDPAKVDAFRQRREQIALRVPAETLERLRATGRGWQTRIVELLEAVAARLPDPAEGGSEGLTHALGLSRSSLLPELEAAMRNVPASHEVEIDAPADHSQPPARSMAHFPDWPAAMTLDEAAEYSRIRKTVLRQHLSPQPLGANGALIVSRRAVDGLIDQLLGQADGSSALSRDMDFGDE